MNIRYFVISASFGLAAIAALPSQAAVTILGDNSLAQSCYKSAEFGGNPQFGIETCTQALTTQPLSYKDRAATLVNRGILRATMGDSPGALNDYDQGLYDNPNLAEAYVDRGAVMISLKRWDDALSNINKGIALGAKREHIAYYDRAIVQEAMGNVRAAYDDYKKASEIEPGFTLATQQLERFHVVRKKSDGA